MRELLLALVLLTAPLLAGCLGGDDDSTGERVDLKSRADVSETTGGIQGVVTDAAIQPVEGATVTLTETFDETTTESDGSFAFSDVSPGTYNIEMEAEGFIGSTQEVTVSSGQVSVLDVVMANKATDVPFMQQLEFTGFVECSVRAGVGFAACGAVNLVAGGNATNDRFLFTWSLEENVTQMVSEIQWEANQPAGQYLSFTVEPDGLSNDRQTEFGDERGDSPLILRTDRERFEEVDANTTAICNGEKDPEDPALSAESDAYCNRQYIDQGGPVQGRIFVSGDPVLPVGVGAAFQQEYQVIVTMFYHAPACEDFSVFEGNTCEQQGIDA